MPFGDIQSLLEIEGATSVAELVHLFELARSVQKGCIVEIGSFQGRSTVALALGAMQGHGAPVFCIEPHEAFTGVLGGRFGPSDRAAFFRNMVERGVAEQVRLINLSSEVVTPGWRLPVALLWIDGDHRYEAVQRDVECWSRHLTTDAKMVLDDAEYDGPSRVIAQQVASGWTLEKRVGKTATLIQRLGTAL